MNCQEVHRRLLAGEQQGIAQHLAECGACAELAKDGSILEALSSEPDPGGSAPDGLDVSALWANTETSLEREATGWRRAASWSTPVRLSVVAATGMAILGGVFLATRRADWNVYPGLRLAIEFGVLCLAAVIAGWVALRPIYHRSWSRGREWVLAAFAVTLTLVIASLPEAHHAHPASMGGTGADLLPRALSCFGWGSGFAIAACGVFLVLARGRHQLRDLPPAVWGASAIIASLALMLHCPLVAPLHLQVGHASVGVVLLGAAALLTRRKPTS